MLRFAISVGSHLNPGKTKFLIIGTRQLQRSAAIEPTISLLSKNLIASAFASDLGTILDSTLSYDEHVTKLVTCMSKLCQINRVKDCFNKDTLKFIIESLVLNIINYIIVRRYGPIHRTQILKNYNLFENFATRIITGARKFDRITPYFQQLGWLSVKDHTSYRDLLLMFKCINGMAPEYLHYAWSNQCPCSES